MTKTFEESARELREAWLTFAYQVLKPFVSVASRLGMTPRPWVQEQQKREQERGS